MGLSLLRLKGHELCQDRHCSSPVPGPRIVVHLHSKAPAFALAADKKLPALSHSAVPKNPPGWLSQELFAQLNEASHNFPVAQLFCPRMPAAHLQAIVLWSRGEISPPSSSEQGKPSEMTSLVLQVRTCTRGVTAGLLTSDPSFLGLVTACSSPHAPPESSAPPWHRGRKQICRADGPPRTSSWWGCYVVGRQ